MSRKRDAAFDIAKGILILCVVIGHGGSDSIGDFVYRFHMPLFFILSGYFMRKHADVGGYLKEQFIKLMIPYFLYMSIDFLFFDHLHDLNRVLHYLWGGRFINGVYWYVTCFFISSVLFVAMLKYLPSRKAVLLSAAGGGIALIESQLIPAVPLLQKPGIPFDADVAFLCISYLAIGYYGKPMIDKWRKSEQLQVRLATTGIGIILITEFVVVGGRTLDMKQGLYPNLIYDFLIPIGYGLVLLRLCRLIAARSRFVKMAFQVMGQTTIPIMYLHEPLNRYLSFSQENVLIYMLVGIGIPVLLAMLLQKHQRAKYIGIYSIRLDQIHG